MNILMQEALEIEFRRDPSLKAPHPVSPHDSLTDTEDESPRNVCSSVASESNVALLSSHVHNLHHSLYSVTRKKSWTLNEDKVLTMLVEQFGNDTPWSEIATHLPGRSGKQCRERWHNHLDVGIKKEQWTEEEDKMLVEMHEVYGNKWAQITKHLPGRRDNAVKNRFHALQRLFTRNDPKNLIQVGNVFSDSSVLRSKRKVLEDDDSAHKTQPSIDDQKPSLQRLSVLPTRGYNFPIQFVQHDYNTFIAPTTTNAIGSSIFPSGGLALLGAGLLSSGYSLTPISSFLSTTQSKESKFPKLDYLAALTSQLNSDEQNYK